MAIDREVRPSTERSRPDLGRAHDVVDVQPPAGAPRPLAVVGVLAVLVVVAVVVPLVTAARNGALGIPRSDDWSYFLTLFRFVDTGRWAFNDWVSMTLVGQILLAAPVVAMWGDTITGVQVLTAILGLVGLLAVISMGRRLVRPIWYAVLVALVIAVGPLWGPLAASFMTDIPAFAFAMLALAIGVEALRRRPVSLPILAASLAVSFVAFSIREYGIIPAIAVSLASIWIFASQGDRKRVRTVVKMFSVLLVCAVVLLVWWHGVPQARSFTPQLPDIRRTKSTVYRTAEFLRLVAFLISPVILFAGPVRIVRRAWGASRRLTLILAIGVFGYLEVIHLHLPKTPFVGNYLSPDGVLSQAVLIGKRPRIVPGLVFNVMVVLGSAFAAVLVLAAVPGALVVIRRLRARELHPADAGSPVLAAVALTGVGYCVTYVIAVFTGFPFYDRYALPVLPIAGLLVLRATRSAPQSPPNGSSGERVRPARVPSTPRTLVVASGALVVFATLGLLYSVDSAKFDGTRWEVATLAVQKGYTAKQVDGGFEWTSYHFNKPPGHIWGNPKRGPNFRPANPGKKRKNKHLPHFCVHVLVNVHNRADRVVASRNYVLPTGKLITVAAVRTTQACPGVPTGH